jgi:hypothetical protein
MKEKRAPRALFRSQCRQPGHYVFPFEKCGAKEQKTRSVSLPACFLTAPSRRGQCDWKEAWEKAKERSASILKQDSKDSKKADASHESDKSASDQNKSLTRLKAKSESLTCRFDDLRHTAVTRLLEAGIPHAVVANMMGWSAATAIRMAKRYQLVSLFNEQP